MQTTIMNRMSEGEQEKGMGFMMRRRAREGKGVHDEFANFTYSRRQIDIDLGICRPISHR